MKTRFLLLCLAVGLLSSCSSRFTYFTKGLYEEENWNADDVERIQFYLSKDIILTRAMGNDETRIAEGKIKVVNGRRVEQVILRAKTPGVLVHMPREDRFGISFEEADDDAYLMFGPNAKQSNRYVLLAQEWERNHGQIHYKGKLYSVDAASAYSSLMVDMKNEGESDYKIHKVLGRTVKP